MLLLALENHILVTKPPNCKHILRKKLSKFEIIEPNPKIPSNIKIISDKAQKSAMGRTCCLSNP